MRAAVCLHRRAWWSPRRILRLDSHVLHRNGAVSGAGYTVAVRADRHVCVLGDGAAVSILVVFRGGAGELRHASVRQADRLRGSRGRLLPARNEPVAPARARSGVPRQLYSRAAAAARLCGGCRSFSMVVTEAGAGTGCLLAG